MSGLRRTLSTRPGKEDAAQQHHRFPQELHENILYFIEKLAPRLDPLQREIVRILRKIAQYFYPQRQSQVMDEGCGTLECRSGVRTPMATTRCCCVRCPPQPPDRAALVSAHRVKENCSVFDSCWRILNKRCRPFLSDWRHVSDRPVRPELVERLHARSALASTSSARTVEEDMSETCT